MKRKSLVCLAFLGLLLSGCDIFGDNNKNNDNYTPTNDIEYHFAEEWSHDESYHWHACLDEGYEDITGSKEAHKFGEWEDINEEGDQKRTCSVCGHEQTQTIEEKCGYVITCREYNEDGYYAWITNGAKISGKMVFPDEVAGHPIIKISIENQDKITSVNIPKYVSVIGVTDFNGCSSLTEINVDPSNANFSSLNGVLYNKDKTNLIRFPSGKGTTFTVPNSVEEISENAFETCSKLTSLVLSDSVTTLNKNAFAYCTSLTSFSIPDGVKVLPTDLFYCCENLSNITIPSSVEEFGYYAFYNTSFTSFIIPNTVTRLYGSCFAECKKLESFTFGTGYEYIPESFFKNCTKLTTLNLQPNLISIGSHAFENCLGIKSITLPSTLYGLAEGAFYKASNLKTLVFNGMTSTSLQKEVFRGCVSLENITLPNNITTIKDYAFAGCTKLATLPTTSNLSEICEGAFYFCTSLTSISIPNSVTTIGDSAFKNCSNLTSVTLSDNLTSIGTSVFYGCSFSDLNHFDNGYYIGSYSNPHLYLHSTDWDITSCVINSNCVFIGFGSFWNRTKITSMNIPVSVKSIVGTAFSGCINLSSLTYEGETSQWKNIHRGESWHYDTKLTVVVCIDGTISVDATN